MNPSIRCVIVCFSALHFVAIVASRAEGQDPRMRTPSDNSGQVDLLSKILNGESSPPDYQLQDQDDAITRLEKQRINCGYAECAGLRIRVQVGSEKIDLLLEAKRRLSFARLEFHRDDDEKLKVLKEQLEDAKSLEKSFADRVVHGLVRPEDLAKAAFFRVSTELAIERLKRSKDQTNPGK